MLAKAIDFRQQAQNKSKHRSSLRTPMLISSTSRPDNTPPTHPNNAGSEMNMEYLGGDDSSISLSSISRDEDSSLKPVALSAGAVNKVSTRGLLDNKTNTGGHLPGLDCKFGLSITVEQGEGLKLPWNEEIGVFTSYSILMTDSSGHLTGQTPVITIPPNGSDHARSHHGDAVWSYSSQNVGAYACARNHPQDKPCPRLGHALGLAQVVLTVWVIKGTQAPPAHTLDVCVPTDTHRVIGEAVVDLSPFLLGADKIDGWFELKSADVDQALALGRVKAVISPFTPTDEHEHLTHTSKPADTRVASATTAAVSQRPAAQPPGQPSTQDTGDNKQESSLSVKEKPTVSEANSSSSPCLNRLLSSSSAASAATANPTTEDTDTNEGVGMSLESAQLFARITKRLQMKPAAPSELRAHHAINSESAPPAAALSSESNPSNPKGQVDQGSMSDFLNNLNLDHLGLGNLSEFVVDSVHSTTDSANAATGSSPTQSHLQTGRFTSDTYEGYFEKKTVKTTTTTTDSAEEHGDENRATLEGEEAVEEEEEEVMFSPEKHQINQNDLSFEVRGLGDLSGYEHVEIDVTVDEDSKPSVSNNSNNSTNPGPVVNVTATNNSESPDPVSVVPIDPEAQDEPPQVGFKKLILHLSYLSQLILIVFHTHYPRLQSLMCFKNGLMLTFIKST